jgi:predicted MFS family arabinose efflux permease
MSRRSHVVQGFCLVGVFLLAVFLTTNLPIGDAVAWCLVAIGVAGFCGTVLGFALDEYLPPKPGWWRVGWRR